MKRSNHRSMFRVMALILFAALVVGVVIPIFSRAADTGSLGQLVDSFEVTGNDFSLTTSSRFFIVSESSPSPELTQTVQLTQRKFAAAGYPSSSVMPIYWGDEEDSQDGDILIVLDTALTTGEEGYQLTVSDCARVSAAHVDGLLYGLDMLLKHCRATGTTGAVTIKGFTSTDIPDTPERIVSLDCGRKYFTKEWICNFIREMSWMGYNTLEMHFSEDCGFRVDIWDDDLVADGFYKNDFSWACGGALTYWQYGSNDYVSYKYYLNEYPNADYPDMNKYLTADELIEIFEVAKEYHIDIIPAFDSPSHLDYLTWRFYQYCTQTNTSYSFKSTLYNTTYTASSHNNMINYSTLALTKEHYNDDFSVGRYFSAVDIRDKSMGKAFIFEMYIDIANFFKEYAGSTTFNVCADEVNLESSYGQVWGFDTFVTYMNELTDMLQGKGYTVRACNDFLGSTAYGAESSLYDNELQILYWNSPWDVAKGTSDGSTQTAAHYVSDGRTVYNAIQTATYYVLRYTNGGTDARGTSSTDNSWSFYNTNEEDIYNLWNPFVFRETGDYDETGVTVSADNLGGAYFMIWCDFCWFNTESELWNGAVGKTGEIYYMRDIMWSNIIKMWNSDLNDSLTYSSFADIRENFGTCPGVSGCSSAASFSASTSPVAASLTYTHTIVYRSLEDNSELMTQTAEAKSGSFKIALEKKRGFSPVRSDRGSVITEDGEYYLQGSANAALQITVWCDAAGDVARLNSLLSDANQEVKVNDGFTYDYSSWLAYENAISQAQTVDYSSQTEIDALEKAIESAHTALVIEDYQGESFIRIQKLADKFPVGKQVGLYAVTSPDVRFLAVSDDSSTEQLSFSSAQVQEVGGEIVKCWLLYFTADTAGDISYTVSYGSISTTVDVTVSK